MDFENQIAQALRRQQDAQGRSQYQAPQGRMAGRVYVAPNALEYMASLLRSAGAGAEAQMAGKEAQQLTQQRTEGTQKALADFLRQSQGQPAITLPEDQAGPVLPAQAPDPMGAYSALLNAPDAGLRQMGLQGMVSTGEAQRKSAENQRLMGILQNSTPQQAIAAGVPPELVQKYHESRNFGREKVEFKDVGGQLVPVTQYGDTPEGVKPLDKTGNPFSDILVRDPATGQVVPNAPLVGAKRDIAAAGRPTVTVNNVGPREFEKQIAGLDAKQLDAWRDKAEQAASSLSTAQRLRDAEAQGAFSGGLAEQKLAVAILINGVTGITPKGLPGSELFNAEASKLVLEHIKGLGANPSNADREFIEKTVPRLATSREARQAMVDFIERSAQRTIQTYQDMDAYARKNSGLGGYRMPGPVGAKPAAPAQGGAVVDFGSLR